MFVSSPIGLGHARRDIAIARELRARVPGLEIDWLAQEPTRRALEVAGERVHPLSDHLMSEAGHIDAWAGEHELWVFEAIRRMEEVLVANYMVFRDLVHAEDYDLWVADEAWELDHFLHENPGDKRAPFVWMTDFVGWIPLPEHGEQRGVAGRRPQRGDGRARRGRRRPCATCRCSSANPATSCPTRSAPTSRASPTSRAGTSPSPGRSWIPCPPTAAATTSPWSW